MSIGGLFVIACLDIELLTVKNVGNNNPGVTSGCNSRLFVDYECRPYYVE